MCYSSFQNLWKLKIKLTSSPPQHQQSPADQQRNRSSEGWESTTLLWKLLLKSILHWVLPSATGLKRFLTQRCYPAIMAIDGAQHCKIDLSLGHSLAGSHAFWNPVCYLYYFSYISLKNKHIRLSWNLGLPTPHPLEVLPNQSTRATCFVAAIQTLASQLFMPKILHLSPPS